MTMAPSGDFDYIPISDGPDEQDFSIPALTPIPAATHICTPQGWRRLASVGGGPWHSAGYPIVEAVKDGFKTSGATGKPVSVALVEGNYFNGNVMQFGGGDAGQKAYRADWLDFVASGEIPPTMEVYIYGGTNDPAAVHVSGMQVRRTRGGTASGGIKRFHLQNLTVVPPPGGQAGIRSGEDMLIDGSSDYSVFAMYNCHFANNPSVSNGSQKWSLRNSGRMAYDIRGVHLRESGIHSGSVPQEHVLYQDSVQPVPGAGGSWFQGVTMAEDAICSRTMIQTVNRNLVFNPGASGTGTLVYEGCRATRIWQTGGSAYTIAGHPDFILIRDCSVINPERETGGGCHGAIAIWRDDQGSDPSHVNDHTASTTAGGHYNGQVRIEGFVALLGTGIDRQACMIADCDDVQFRNSFQIDAGAVRPHIVFGGATGGVGSFNPDGADNTANGSNEFRDIVEPSQVDLWDYPGFIGTGDPRVRIGLAPDINEATLNALATVT